MKGGSKKVSRLAEGFSKEDVVTETATRRMLDTNDIPGARFTNHLCIFKLKYLVDICEVMPAKI